MPKPKKAKTEDSTPPVIVYWTEARGNAESARLALAVAGKTWVNEAPQDSAEAKAKAAGTPELPFGQWPVMRKGDGAVIAQSLAILREIGRENGMYNVNAAEDCRIDQLLEALKDIRGKLSVLKYEHKLSDAGKKEFELAYLTGELHLSRGCGVGLVENFVKRSTTGWAASTKKASIADVYLFNVFEMLAGPFTKERIEALFPAIAATCAKLAAVPSLKAYLDDEKRPKP